MKFKTAEKVGPVGEGRSAEAQAIVTVEKHDWAGAMLSSVITMCLAAAVSEIARFQLASSTICRPYSQRPRSCGPVLFDPNVNFAPAAFAIRMNERWAACSGY